MAIIKDTRRRRKRIVAWVPGECIYHWHTATLCKPSLKVETQEAAVILRCINIGDGKVRFDEGYPTASYLVVFGRTRGSPVTITTVTVVRYDWSLASTMSRNTNGFFMNKIKSSV